jgi:hypothetical protein
MGEVGCLKDGHFQNLQVEGHARFHTTDTIHDMFGELQVHGRIIAQTIITTGIQRLATDAILTIATDTSLVLFAHAGASTSRIITLPVATAGRQFKILWELTQTGSDRVLTAAGTDTITGQIFTSVTANAAGDGDVVSVAAASTAITVVDDVFLGSVIDFYCGVAGTWIVNGQLVVDAVGSVPTVTGGG